MGVTKQQIEAALKVEDDFGHEMRIGGLLKNVNAPPASYLFERTIISHPSHGGTYQDPLTAKPRQFDYRCKITNETDGGTRVILLPIECKNVNLNSPLVVCGRSRDIGESWHDMVNVEQSRGPQIRKPNGSGSFYEPGEFVGKSLFRTQIADHRNKPNSAMESEIYDRWSQALASSRDMVAGSLNNPAKQLIRTFILPLIVLPDESLWSAHYNYNGEINDGPSQIDNCAFYVDHTLKFPMPFGTHLQPNVTFSISHIHFVTLKGLSKILTEFANANFWQWDKIFR